MTSGFNTKGRRKITQVSQFNTVSNCKEAKMNLDDFIEKEKLPNPKVGDRVVETRNVSHPLRGTIREINEHMVVIDREDNETWYTSIRWYGKTWKLL